MDLVHLACEDTHVMERSGLSIFGLRRYTRYGTKWTLDLWLAKVHTLCNEVGLRRYTRNGTKLTLYRLLAKIHT